MLSAVKEQRSGHNRSCVRGAVAIGERLDEFACACAGIVDIKWRRVEYSCGVQNGVQFCEGVR